MTEIVLAILRRNNQFLLTQQSSGIWNFPGGKVDQKDITALTTANRKLKEETGLKGKRFRKLCTIYLQQSHIQFFCCDQWNGELKPIDKDIIRVEWFGWVEMYLLKKSLSKFINDHLLYLSYLIQHYDHHINEWHEPWREV